MLVSIVTSLTCPLAQECVSENGKSLCESMSGQCVITQDGYYYVSAICLVLGTLTLVLYIIPTARRLEGKSYSTGPGFNHY